MKVARSKFVAIAPLVTTLLSASCLLVGHRGVDARIVRPSLRTDALGCWALFDQAGHTVQGSLYWAPAVAVLLDTRESSATSMGEFRIIKLDSVNREMPAEDRRGFAYWTADSLSDSIRIGVSSGFSGTQFVFALPTTGRSRDTLRGRAYEHWDYKANTNRGRAMAVRRPCRSPS